MFSIAVLFVCFGVVFVWFGAVSDGFECFSWVLPFFCFLWCFQGFS